MWPVVADQLPPLSVIGPWEEHGTTVKASTKATESKRSACSSSPPQFAAQDGLATFAQLRQAEVGRKARRHRIDGGEWRAVDRTVIELAGAPDSWHRDARRALLSVGDAAAISHVTAGRLHGFDGLDRNAEIHVTVCGLTHHTGSTGVVVHRSSLSETKSCIEVDGMRVVSKPIALIQIAATTGGAPRSRTGGGGG